MSRSIKDYHPHKRGAKELAIAEGEQKENARLMQEIEDIGLLMGEKWGRRLAFEILERSGLIFDDAMPDDGLFNPTVSVMHKDVGRRQVGWRWDHLIRRHFNHLWILMLEENTEVA